MHLKKFELSYENTFRILKLAMMVFYLVFSTIPYTYAENNKDTRKFVPLPDNIKENTLIIMRDHIHVLEDIIHSIQSEDYKKAEQIVETRLSWGSTTQTSSHKIIKYWPEPMQHMANQLFHAARNYVAISQKAVVKENKQSEEGVIAALGEVITACRSCHETYRIR